MNRIVFILFFCVLIISCQVALSQNEEIVTYTSGEWEYIENKTGITLTVWHGSSKDLEIPAVLDEKPVTALGKDLCKNNNELQRVYIPDNVTTIGSNVFNGCMNLTEVRLPLSLSKIDTGTFRYCINLEHIEIPLAVTSINNFAFADCVKLQEAILLNVTSIGESAFDNCQNLSSVMISRKTTSVGGYAFRDTPWLENQTDEFVMIGKGVLIKWNGTGSDVEVPFGTTVITSAFADAYYIENVTIPETVTQIGQYAFRDAINLKQVNIPQYVTTIGASAFEGCRSLESIVLPNSVKSLGGASFNNCGALTNFTIPPQVTSIPFNFLANCSELTDVIIPESVTNINKNAFTGSPKVQLYISYGSDAERLLQEYEMPYSYTLQETLDFIYSQDENGIRILKYIGNLYDVEVPAGINGAPVVAIDVAAFQNNGRVRRINIPMTVKEIGDWAFSYMEELQTVQLSSGLEQIGANVFTGSTALREIKLPKSLIEIGTAPFDEGTTTMICAVDGSEAALQLAAMGYDVQPEAVCADDEELAALWAELNALEPATDSCDCGQHDVSAAYYSSSDTFEIVRVPVEVTTLTAGLLENTAQDLVLVIPSSVSQIGEDILDSHNILTIVSESGSVAEAFARDHGIKFLMRFEFRLNVG